MDSRKALELFLLHDLKPIRGFLKNLSFSLCSTVIAVLILYSMGKGVNWKQATGMCTFTSSIFFFGWGAERLWYASIFKMLQNPLLIFSYLSRIPFWFIAGGAGLSLTVLFAYKSGLTYISIYPQSHLFFWGGIIECLVQVPLQFQLIKKFNTHIEQFA
jgi:hypothetical protein